MILHKFLVDKMSIIIMNQFLTVKFTFILIPAASSVLYTGHNLSTLCISFSISAFGADDVTSISISMSPSI